MLRPFIVRRIHWIIIIIFFIKKKTGTTVVETPFNDPLAAATIAVTAAETTCNDWKDTIAAATNDDDNEEVLQSLNATSIQQHQQQDCTIQHTEATKTEDDDDTWLQVIPYTKLLSYDGFPIDVTKVIVPPKQRTVPQLQSQLQRRMRQINHYLQHVVDVEDQYILVRNTCRSKINHTDCLLWSIPSYNGDNIDYCNVYDHPTEHRTYIEQNGCYAFCFQCEYYHIESICPIDPNTKNAWYPYDLHTMFTNIVKQYSNIYNITVLSQPTPAAQRRIDDSSIEVEDEEDDDDDDDAPWIIQMDDFLTIEEAQILIDIGHTIGYTRSLEIGELDEFGYERPAVSTETESSSSSSSSMEDIGNSIYRTSSTAWCDDEMCTEHPVVQTLYHRLEQLLHISSSNSEAFQLLQYQPGQFYYNHHDYIDYEIRRQQGVRILTVFIYLNTMPTIEEYNTNTTMTRNFTIEQIRNNGGTHFTEMNRTVLPQVGRVIIWPNVYNRHPHIQDDRLYHAAHIVTHGTKYAINAWYHQRPLVCDAME